MTAVALRWSAAAAFAAAATGSAACSVPACSEPASPDADAPALTSFSLDSQMATDPWTAVFAAVFTDADGDLGNGSAEFFLGGSKSDASVKLRELFRQSGLPLNATSGTIGIPLRFGETVSDGATVELGAQLVDAAAKRSNCYALELTFGVQQVVARSFPCNAVAQGGGAAAPGKT